MLKGASNRRQVVIPSALNPLATDSAQAPKPAGYITKQGGSKTQEVSYERTWSKQEDKNSGGYEQYTIKELVSRRDSYKDSGSGRVGEKDEFKRSSTAKFGDKKGYTEYYKEECIQNVRFGDGSYNYGIKSELPAYKYVYDSDGYDTDPNDNSVFQVDSSDDGRTYNNASYDNGGSYDFQSDAYDDGGNYDDVSEDNDFQSDSYDDGGGYDDASEDKDFQSDSSDDASDDDKDCQSDSDDDSSIRNDHKSYISDDRCSYIGAWDGNYYFPTDCGGSDWYSDDGCWFFDDIGSYEGDVQSDGYYSDGDYF